MEHSKKSKIDKKLFLKLYNEYKSDGEIAKIMNTPRNTICYFRKEILELPISRDNIELTTEEEEILIGTLLGDSTILYAHSACKNPHLTFVHSVKQEEYFDTKFKNLKKIMSSSLKRQYNTTVIIKGKSTNQSMIKYAIGKNLKCLKFYREIFYPKGKKIIPINYIKDKFTNQSLAYLFMDDGCKNGKTINLNLNCFELDNLKDFIEFLKDKFNIEFNIKKDKTLYLRYKSRKIFYNLIISYITTDSLYKIQHLRSSLNLVNLGKSSDR